MIGFKASKEFKDFLKAQAKKENRTLSNFIMNALIIYVKEHRGMDWHKEESK